MSRAEGRRGGTDTWHRGIADIRIQLDKAPAERKFVNVEQSRGGGDVQVIGDGILAHQPELCLTIDGQIKPTKISDENAVRRDAAESEVPGFELLKEHFAGSSQMRLGWFDDALLEFGSISIEFPPTGEESIP